MHTRTHTRMHTHTHTHTHTHKSKAYSCHLQGHAYKQALLSQCPALAWAPKVPAEPSTIKRDIRCLAFVSQ